jgi:hypothetical protein
LPPLSLPPKAGATASSHVSALGRLPLAFISLRVDTPRLAASV